MEKNTTDGVERPAGDRALCGGGRHQLRLDSGLSDKMD